MTEVVRRACEFAFEEWHLAKIAAHVFAFNVASARVLEKCGLVRMGTNRDFANARGQEIEEVLLKVP